MTRREQRDPATVYEDPAGRRWRPGNFGPLCSGYRIYAVNPRQAARFKERYGTSGAKSDKGDAHALADVVRIDGPQLRPVAGDSDQAQAVKVVARAHQTLICERTRTFQRLRNTSVWDGSLLSDNRLSRMQALAIEH